MLIDAFYKWKYEGNAKGLPYKEDQDIFNVFYQNHTLGKNLADIISEIAYEIYELQECVEGLLEDQGD